MYYADPVEDYSAFLSRVVAWLLQIQDDQLEHKKQLERNKRLRKAGKSVIPLSSTSSESIPYRIPCKGDPGDLNGSIWNLLKSPENHPFRGLGSYSVEEVLFLAGK